MDRGAGGGHSAARRDPDLASSADPVRGFRPGPGEPAEPPREHHRRQRSHSARLVAAAYDPGPVRATADDRPPHAQGRRHHGRLRVRPPRRLARNGGGQQRLPDLHGLRPREVAGDTAGERVRAPVRRRSWRVPDRTAAVRERIRPQQAAAAQGTGEDGLPALRQPPGQGRPARGDGSGRRRLRAKSGTTRDRCR